MIEKLRAEVASSMQKFSPAEVEAEALLKWASHRALGNKTSYDEF